MSKSIISIPEYKTLIVRKLRTFFKSRSDVFLAFVFGSFVSNKMTSASDIDIGILFNTNPDIYELNNIKEDLSALLKKDVDVVLLNGASPVLRMQVLKKGELVFQKDRRYYSSYYGDTVKQYDDLKRIREKCEENILKGRIYA